MPLKRKPKLTAEQEAFVLGADYGVTEVQQVQPIQQVQQVEVMPQVPQVEPNFKRTAKGYQRANGENLERVTLFLSNEQKAELKRRAVGYAGITEYIVNELGL